MTDTTTRARDNRNARQSRQTIRRRCGWAALVLLLAGALGGGPITCLVGGVCLVAAID